MAELDPCWVRVSEVRERENKKQSQSIYEDANHRISRAFHHVIFNSALQDVGITDKCSLLFRVRLRGVWEGKHAEGLGSVTLLMS